MDERRESRREVKREERKKRRKPTRKEEKGRMEGTNEIGKKNGREKWVCLNGNVGEKMKGKNEKKKR